MFYKLTCSGSETSTLGDPGVFSATSCVTARQTQKEESYGTEVGQQLGYVGGGGLCYTTIVLLITEQYG